MVPLRGHRVPRYRGLLRCSGARYHAGLISQRSSVRIRPAPPYPLAYRGPLVEALTYRVGVCMAWSNSTHGSRRTSLPATWGSIRAAVLERDGRQCTYYYDGSVRCIVTTHLEVDHIGDRDDHSMVNLRTLCHEHHKERTQRQAQEARARLPRRERPKDTKHPGML
jgi:5-methylcytosine-specific restriction protein A